MTKPTAQQRRERSREAQAAYKARMRADGFTLLAKWVPVCKKDEVSTHCDKICADYLREKLDRS